MSYLILSSLTLFFTLTLCPPQVIEAVRLQAHKYDVPLSLDEYRKLLSISYLISPTTKDKVSNGSTDEDEIPPLVGSGRQAWKSDQDKRKDLNRKALVCVRTVKNVSVCECVCVCVCVCECVCVCVCV